MMRVYWVSYDLRAPGRDYSHLYARLNDWGAVRALESDWLIRTDNRVNAHDIREDLRNYLDSNDGVLVARLEGNVSGFGIKPEARTLLVHAFGPDYG